MDKENEPDLDQTLSSAFDEIEKREAQSAADDQPQHDDQQQSQENPPSDAAAPTRGPDGKFIPKNNTAEGAAPDQQSQVDPNAAPPQQKPDPKTATTSAKEGVTPQADQQQAASQAPSSWSADNKKAWNSLPPAIRHEVLKRETEIARYVQGTAEKVKRLEAIDAVVQPHQRQQMAGHYGTFERGVQELLALSDFAGSRPYDFVAYFMQQRSLDPQQLLQIIQRGAPAQQQTQGQPQQQQPFNLPPQANPQAANSTDQRLAAIEQRFQEQQTQTVKSVVDAFLAEKDAGGNPAHPYFHELADQIAYFVEQGQPLPQAYESAVWASPVHRDMMMQKQNQSQDAVRKKQQEEQAKTARRAADIAGATKSNGGASPAKAGSGDWRETVDSIGKNVTGRDAA